MKLSRESEEARQDLLAFLRPRLGPGELTEVSKRLARYVSSVARQATFQTPKPSGIAELVDVFFNGRKAR